MGELDVDLGVRLVAARGNVEIVQFEPRLSAEDDMEMTRVALGAEVAPGEATKGMRETIATP